MTGLKTISNRRDLIAELEGCIQDLLDQGGAPKPPTVMGIIELYDTLPEWGDWMVTFACAVLTRWGN